MNDENENEHEGEAPEVEAEIEDAGDESSERLERRSGEASNRHQRAIFGVPVRVVVSVGAARPTIGELLNMKRDSLLPLDSKLEDPVDLMIGKRVVARGELQEIDDGEGRLGVRLTEIVDLSEPF